MPRVLNFVLSVMKTFKCLLILLGISLCVLVVHAGAECKDEEFECMDGKCIPKAYLCNEQKDCKDGEDEEHQWCGELKWKLLFSIKF